MTESSTARPRVVLSVAVSVDGYLDDTSPQRLMLSNAEDLDAVDALRADCDAILIGAGTVRADDPRLVIRSEARRQERLAKGMPPDLIKVTLTESGRLEASHRFFQVGGGEKIVYCSLASGPALQDRLGDLATVIAADTTTWPVFILADLSARGVRKLLIEGGSTVNTLFLSAGLVDEIRLAIAPFFVGEERASRFVNPARFPHSKDRRMTIKAFERLGDVAVIWYSLESAST